MNFVNGIALMAFVVWLFISVNSLSKEKNTSNLSAYLGTAMVLTVLTWLFAFGVYLIIK